MSGAPQPEETVPGMAAPAAYHPMPRRIIRTLRLALLPVDQMDSEAAAQARVVLPMAIVALADVAVVEADSVEVLAAVELNGISPFLSPLLRPK